MAAVLEFDATHEAERAVLVMSLRLTGLIAQAEMDMHAVADAISHRHRREGRYDIRSRQSPTAHR